MRPVLTALKFGFTLSAAALVLTAMPKIASAEGPAGSPTDQVAKFRQLGPESLPTPNIFRNAAGAPGPAYWQQRASHTIDVKLDEDERRITASMDIEYINGSPDTLNYIWLALDQNRFKDGSLARESAIASAAGSRRGDGSGGDDRYSFGALRYEQAMEDREYGFEFKSVTDSRGRALSYTINDSMMRIDLDQPLAPEDVLNFSIDWEHNIIDEEAVGGRGGYETFPDDRDGKGNDIFGMAQWFPRLAAYTDYTGWQNKQFLGRGEFTLEFGDYEVNIDVPADHIVSATGELQNPADVLTSAQRKRLADAGPKKPLFIVTPEEAEENSKTKSTKRKTWSFKAENVRDFAWSSSRKYIWDAMTFEQDDDKHPIVLAMSFYPPEAEPIWSKYSTQAVVHTMDVYNKFAFNYPYPTAQSVNSWERGGMEYFPMVVNSDEREWTWMDEGLNTFLEYMAEYEWEEDFPTSSNQVPIMTQSDSVLQFGPNAYSKPASSLVVLRETVMGRELFDFAFREYANRWKFKRPTPADFFRTMEDASAVDLDWFWRGWYFGTDHVDMALTSVREYQISSQDPDAEEDYKREQNGTDKPENITQKRNREEGLKTRLQRLDELEDFYNENDKFTTTNKDRNKYKSFINGLKDWEKAAYERAMEDGKYIYFMDFENVGGLISPLPLKITFENGEIEELMVPAEIWRRNSKNVTKLITRKKRIASIELDPHHQTADSNYSNNSFPPSIRRSRIELYKSNYKPKSMMADMLVELKSEGKDGSNNTGKDVPLSNTDGSTADHKSKTNKLNEKESGSLRKTLEKLLSRD